MWPKPETPSRHDSTEGGQWGGLTGIATYALLSAEQSPRDERLQKSIDFLKKAKMRGVYAISMRAQVWPFLPPANDVKEAARRDAQLLMSGVKNKGNAKGLWFYHVDEPKDDRADHSASQFAVLGVWACAEAGVEVPDQFWRLEDSVWREHQASDGTWSYVHKDGGDWGRPFLSMTAAGLATLFITQEKLTDTAGLNCKSLAEDTQIARGMEHIANHFPADFDNPGARAFVPGDGRRTMYLLYGLHRLGLASGYRYFGKSDWFRAGANYLVKSQKDDGSWGNTWETAFGLLFLARGRAPIAVSKLNYAADAKNDAWNQRPRDIANLTAWMGKQAERRINWQVVDFSGQASDWLDAPLLYISGDEEINFSAQQQTTLKGFVEAGGMIVANADCSSSKFSSSIRKLGQTLFPAYEFRELPADHPVYAQQFPRGKWRSKPRVMALSNGVRELVVLLPDADLSRAYQSRSDRSKPELYELGFNLYQYCAGIADLRRRGDSLHIAADPSVQTTRRICVARLKYPGNWDPEPGGWRRLAASLRNVDKIDLGVETIELGKAPINGVSIAHLTGTTPLRLSPEQKAELKRFVSVGGILLVDSAGGSAEFADAIESELASTFDSELKSIDSSHKLFALGDKPLQAFTYRMFARRSVGDLKGPRLRGIEIDGRLAVIHSREDLSLGLVGQQFDGVIGYSSNTTMQIVRRIILSSSENKPSVEAKSQ